MRSMTGFGRAEGEACGLFIEITIRSVNHKSLDLNLRLPRRLWPMENALREQLQKKIFRGRVEVSAQLKPGAAGLTTVEPDFSRVDAVYAALTQIVHRHTMQTQIGLQDLLAVPDLFTETPVELDETALQQEVTAVLVRALDEFLSMREKEADGLRTQLSGNLAGIREGANRLQEHLPQLREEARAKLAQKVEEFLREYPEQQDARLQQELLFYLDKSDVMEELTRLRSHADQLEVLLAGTGPVGKKMDFLAQEMNREANTIASKSQHLTQTEAAIDLKVHVEQMREQIMNLE